MCFGCLGVLILATSGFATEVPPLLEAKLASKDELRGTFKQTKTTAEGEKYVMRGFYHLRPGLDFTWKTLDPFETVFHATKEKYTYSNEDESVTRLLKDMPSSERFTSLSEGDLSVFFKVFDALYKEENGRFFIKAKPKVRDLKVALERVEVEGTTDNWTLKAYFPNKTTFEIEFKDDVH